MTSVRNSDVASVNLRLTLMLRLFLNGIYALCIQLQIITAYPKSRLTLGILMSMICYMKLIKYLRFNIAIVFILSGIFLLEIGGVISFGKFINHFFPCEQNAMWTAACYATYDYYLLILIALLLLLVFLMSVIMIFKYFQRK